MFIDREFNFVLGFCGERQSRAGHIAQGIWATEIRGTLMPNAGDNQYTENHEMNVKNGTTALISVWLGSYVDSGLY